MILKDKITVAIRQDNPERNIFKTIYITRQLHAAHVDAEIMWIRWRGYRWAVRKIPHSESYSIVYCLD